MTGFDVLKRVLKEVVKEKTSDVLVETNSEIEAIDSSATTNSDDDM